MTKTKYETLFRQKSYSSSFSFSDLKLSICPKWLTGSARPQLYRERERERERAAHDQTVDRVTLAGNSSQFGSIGELHLLTGRSGRAVLTDGNSPLVRFLLILCVRETLCDEYITCHKLYCIGQPSNSTLKKKPPAFKIPYLCEAVEVFKLVYLNVFFHLSLFLRNTSNNTPKWKSSWIQR